MFRYWCRWSLRVYALHNRKVVVAVIWSIDTVTQQCSSAGVLGSTSLIIFYYFTDSIDGWYEEILWISKGYCWGKLFLLYIYIHTTTQLCSLRVATDMYLAWSMGWMYLYIYAPSSPLHLRYYIVGIVSLRWCNIFVGVYLSMWNMNYEILNNQI